MLNPLQTESARNSSVSASHRTNGVCVMKTSQLMLFGDKSPFDLVIVRNTKKSTVLTEYKVLSVEPGACS